MGCGLSLCGECWWQPSVEVEVKSKLCFAVLYSSTWSHVLGPDHTSTHPQTILVLSSSHQLTCWCVSWVCF